MMKNLTRKILLLLLILCTLGYSNAWAYDGHVITEQIETLEKTALSLVPASHSAIVDENHSADTHTAQHSQQQTNEQAIHADKACDHCCHISAHLQAIFNQHYFITHIKHASTALDFSENFISLSSSPDLRPPRT